LSFSVRLTLLGGREAYGLPVRTGSINQRNWAYQQQRIVEPRREATKSRSQAPSKLNYDDPR